MSLKSLTAGAQSFGPFASITETEDRYIADGVVYLKAVIGAAVIVDYVAPVVTTPLEPVPSTITRLQLAQGMAAAGLITAAEAETFAGGSAIPAAVTAAINILPADQRSAARIKVAGLSVVERAHPLLTILMAQAVPPISSAQMDAYFIAWGKIA